MTDLTSTHALYSGSGRPRDDVVLPPAPPWRTFAGEVGRERSVPHDPQGASTFVSTPEMRRAVDAALVLRRPLLLTGRPGSGKSSLIESVARELKLGRVLRWHVTSRSSLSDALYRYDAIGRLHAQNLEQRGGASDITQYLRLGPLGTALLPTSHPRALLVDEIDKSDIDLPNDLLNVLERGEYEIPELARLDQDVIEVREDDGEETFPVTRGKIVCQEFPFVVFTSNGERDFPAPFLRRCVRLRMPDPTPDLLAQIVASWLGESTAQAAADLISDFATRTQQSRAHATDQLLNAVFLVMKQPDLPEAEASELIELLTKTLSSDHT